MTLAAIIISDRNVKVVTDLRRQEDIIRQCHEGVGESLECRAASGHFGRDKMVALIFSRWSFPKITERVLQYLRYCDACQRCNTNKIPKGGETMHPISVPEKVWSKIGIDLIGPLKESNGMKYVVTAVDYFSKWPEAQGIPDKCAISVARFLWNLQCRYGPSDINITDQGREFCSQLNERFYELSGVEHKISSAYHPQTNGLVERQNQTTQTILRKTVTSMKDWHNALDSLLFACRVTRHSSTKFTPFMLMFNRDPVIPTELKDNQEQGNPVPPSESGPAMSFKDTLEYMEDLRQKTMPQASANIKKAQASQVYYYNLKHAAEPLAVGTRVLKKNVRQVSRKAKFHPKYLGPYTIVEITEAGNYKLKDKHSHTLANAVPPQQVKRYFKDMDPNLSDDEGDQSQASQSQASSVGDDSQASSTAPASSTASAPSKAPASSTASAPSKAKASSTAPAPSKAPASSTAPAPSKAPFPRSRLSRKRPVPEGFAPPKRATKYPKVSTQDDGPIDVGMDIPPDVPVSEIELEIAENHLAGKDDSQASSTAPASSTAKDDDEDPPAPFHDQTQETSDHEITGFEPGLPMYFEPLTLKMRERGAKSLKLPFNAKREIQFDGEGSHLNVKPPRLPVQ